MDGQPASIDPNLFPAVGSSSATNNNHPQWDPIHQQLTTLPTSPISGTASHRQTSTKPSSNETPHSYLSQNPSRQHSQTGLSSDTANDNLSVDVPSTNAASGSPASDTTAFFAADQTHSKPSELSNLSMVDPCGSDHSETYSVGGHTRPYARFPRGYVSSMDGDVTTTTHLNPSSHEKLRLVGVHLANGDSLELTESEISEYDEYTTMRRSRRSDASFSRLSSVLGSLGKLWDTPSGSYASLPSTQSRSTKRPKWSRSLRSDSTSSSISATAGATFRRRQRIAASPWCRPYQMIAIFFNKLFRTFFGPIHPVTILIALVLIASFVASVTKLIIYILNPDKVPLPWRTYCQNQPPFPHAYADALAPVDIFVGVFSVDSAYQRRHLIRNTYAAHTLPVDPQTGAPISSVQLKFILGKPRQAHARRVALEMETFNDVVVLDMEENMNRGKTHAFFQWAAENATVPLLQPIEGDQISDKTNGVSADATQGRSNGFAQTKEVLGGSPKSPRRFEVKWKKADYIVKADDDAYIILEELERHQRVAPRQMTYWGYLIRNWFMGGECYALSSDLVQYVATSETVLQHTKGKEDKKVAQWISNHPNRSSIHWVSEHCWIYDHPKAGTAYSHGFLYPDHVEKIKLEGRHGLTESEIARRGGEEAAQWYSTVSRWHLPYVEPRRDLTVEEEVEALVEGGGRWSGSWVRGDEKNHSQVWVPREQLIFEADDDRLQPPPLTHQDARPTLADEVEIDSASGLTIRHVYSHPSQAATYLKSRPEPKKRDNLPLLAHLPAVPGLNFGNGGVSRAAAEERRRSFSNSATPPHMVPLATHKNGNGEAEELHRRRYLGRRFGGTVLVHYLKKDEWFYETALAFPGRSHFWSDGAGGTGSEWRMYGSPLVRHEDGYVSEGRAQPPADMELVYLQQARLQAQANAAQAQVLAATLGSFTKPKTAVAAADQHRQAADVEHY